MVCSSNNTLAYNGVNFHWHHIGKDSEHGIWQNL